MNKEVINKTFNTYKEILFFDKEVTNKKIIVKVPYSRFKIILNQYLCSKALYFETDKAAELNSFTLSALSKNKNIFVVQKACAYDEEPRGECSSCNKFTTVRDSDNTCYYCIITQSENYLQPMKLIEC